MRRLDQLEKAVMAVAFFGLVATAVVSLSRGDFRSQASTYEAVHEYR